MPAGRPAKPVQLHLLNGNTRHLTKEAIADRIEHEQKLRSGHKDYKPSPSVKKDPAALAMFKKLRKLYQEIEYVEGLDEMIINRYCLLTGEVASLEQLVVVMRQDLDQCDKFLERIKLYQSIDSVLGKLGRDREMMLKLEDRLFLNPTSRVKNIPKRPAKRTTDPHAGMFGD